MDKKSLSYYIIPNELYKVDGTKVKTVSYNKLSGETLWQYYNSEETHSGTLGVTLFIKDPTKKKTVPMQGDYIQEGSLVNLLNTMTKELGWYLLVRKRGDSALNAPVRVVSGKYYGEMPIKSPFGQELINLQIGDKAVYYFDKKVKIYVVKNIKQTRLYVNQPSYKDTPSNEVLGQYNTTRKHGMPSAGKDMNTRSVTKGSPYSKATPRMKGSYGYWRNK